MKKLPFRLGLAVFLLFLFPMGHLFYSSQAFAGWVVSPEGTLRLEDSGQVLGEEVPAASPSVSPVRLEVKLGTTRVKLEKESEGFKLKLENEAGQETRRLKSQGPDLLKISERSTDRDLTISTHSANRLLLSRRRLGAITDLPIAVSLQTNQLIVSTQAGSRVVAVLPDQAIENLLREKLLDKIGGLKVEEILSEASPSSAFAQAVELKMDSGGEPVYEVEGSKSLKLLGFYPVTLPRRVVISAQTGAVEKVQESILSRFLGLLSL